MAKQRQFVSHSCAAIGIAQKLHAVAEPPLRPGGESPRYRDLIDLQLLQALTGENLAPVKDACQRIFAARGQQLWPPYITTYPDWNDRYTTMASSLDMPITDLDEAVIRWRRNARIGGRGEIAQLVEHTTENIYARKPSRGGGSRRFSC